MTNNFVSEIDAKVGLRVKAIADLKGVTIPELAHHTDIPLSKMQKATKGKAGLLIREIDVVADYLGVELAVVLGIREYVHSGASA